VAGQTLSDLQSIYESSSPVKFQIANVSGSNNRTKGNVIVEGSVIVSALNISAASKQTATYDATLTGVGEFTIGTTPSQS
jgi:predicted secreted protein